MTARVTGGTKYRDWIDQGTAVHRTNRATKQLQRWAAAGTLRKVLWRPDSSSPFRVLYHPADVATRAAPYRVEKPAPGPPAAAIDVEGSAGPPTAPDASEGLARLETGQFAAFAAGFREFLALVGTELRAAPPPPPAEPRPRTVDVETAARELNYTPRQIRAFVRAGTLPAAFSGSRNWRTWRIWREDLERLRPPAPPITTVTYRRKAR